MMTSKQVLVMKKFPKSRNLRTGKYVAQGAHAALGAVFSLGRMDPDLQHFVISTENPFVYEWIVGKFTKVVAYVETDAELEDIYVKARTAGIAAALITDAGLTEFNGEPTLTAVGIGPDDVEKIDVITRHLPLF